MSNDDLCGSHASLDETWCAMLLVNDPNAALIGALRPRPENRLLAQWPDADILIHPDPRAGPGKKGPWT